MRRLFAAQAFEEIVLLVLESGRILEDVESGGGSELHPRVVPQGERPVSHHAHGVHEGPWAVRIFSAKNLRMQPAARPGGSVHGERANFTGLVLGWLAGSAVSKRNQYVRSRSIGTSVGSWPHAGYAGKLIKSKRIEADHC